MNWRCLPALTAAGVMVALSGCCLCEVGVPKTAAEPSPPLAIAETYVVVMPGHNGHIGGVVVNSGAPESETLLLDTAYAAAHVNGAGKQERVPSPTPEEIQQMFGDVAQAKPAPPMSFTVYFGTAGDDVTTESAPVMQEVFAEISRRVYPEVTVIGHTDRVGTVERNDALSSRRARKVRDYLIKHGVAADAVGTAGRGEREPLVPTDEGVAEPKNRRVEINIR
jgi:outer membrane protein OmpA-like peptidoglycan-associated protein